MKKQEYLHGTFVHKHAVELLHGFVGAARLLELNCGYATANTIGPICELYPQDRSNRFAEVFLL